MELDNKEMINSNAVSQIILKKVNEIWAVEFFRLDGSYMTSVTHSTRDAAWQDYEKIKEALSKA